MGEKFKKLKGQKLEAASQLLQEDFPEVTSPAPEQAGIFMSVLSHFQKDKKPARISQMTCIDNNLYQNSVRLMLALGEAGYDQISPGDVRRLLSYLESNSSEWIDSARKAQKPIKNPLKGWPTQPAPSIVTHPDGSISLYLSENESIPRSNLPENSQEGSTKSSSSEGDEKPINQQVVEAQKVRELAQQFNPDDRDSPAFHIPQVVKISFGFWRGECTH